MSRVAFLTSANMLPGAADLRVDAHEYLAEFAALDPACRARGITLEPVVWDAAREPWTAFDAVMIGTAWDYWDKADAFLAELDAIEAAGVALYNSASVARWNLDKGYLRDLAARGAPAIPTLYEDAADAAAIAQAFDALGVDELVVKPRVGAGAVRLARIKRGDALPPAEKLPAGACLIQPFLPSVPAEGEISYLFFGGVFSHAVRKIPKAGDFRVQSAYGAREIVHEPAPDELDGARAALAAVDADLLYARVDMVKGLDGRPALIELEVIEPYYYPLQGPRCGEIFADALERYLAAGAPGASVSHKGG